MKQTDDTRRDVGELLLQFDDEMRQAEGPYERSRTVDDYTDDLLRLFRSEGREPDAWATKNEVETMRRSFTRESFRPGVPDDEIVPVYFGTPDQP